MIHEISPWWDMRLLPPEARQSVLAQQHRRLVKTHLPADALTMSEKARSIYVARDGRDVLWSMYNHHHAFRDDVYELLNGPGLVGEPMARPDPDIRRYFRTWLEKDGYPFWSFWEHMASWWALRNHPRVMLVHFNGLKVDLEREMRSIAAFLEIDLPKVKWPEAVRHCTFDYMKANAERYAPGGGAIWEGGAGIFINKGTNGRWKDVLSAEESAAYEQAALERLGGDCAHWLMTGERPRRGF
jgi:aryl sulfotransferase